MSRLACGSGTATIVVGVEGDGEMTISNGGQVEVDDLFISSAMTEPGHSGEVLVTGSESELLVRNVVELAAADGPANRAVFAVEGGAYAEIQDELIIHDDGVARLAAGRLRCQTITMLGATPTFNFTGGQLDCETFDGTLHNFGGAITPGGTDSIGSMHITGNLGYTIGVVSIDLQGGLSDTIVIDGSAQLADNDQHR